MLHEWFQTVQSAAEETAFIVQAEKDFKLAAPETVNSLILVQEYKDDCDLYSDSIEASY